jgi:hypothetical protein
VFEPGFTGVIQGRLATGDCLLGVSHYGALAAVAQVRSFRSGAHLNHFAVRREHQGWGLAEMLLNGVHARFSNVATSLHVDGRNRRAFNFYQRFGYQIVQSEPFVLISLSDAPTAGGGSGLTRESQLELQANGFCKVLLPEHAYPFTYLTGRRVYIGSEFRARDVMAVGEWLGEGRMVLPERMKPSGWTVKERWDVHTMERAAQ